VETKDKIDLSLKVFAALVAAFGVWKYFEDRSEAARLTARAESLKVVRDFSSEAMLEARKALVQFWRSQPDFARYVAGADSMSANEYAMFVRRAVPAYAKFDAIEVALFQLNDYFDAAYHCRASEVCDAALLNDFLCTKAPVLFDVYGPFFQILNRQIASQDFGESLRAHVDLCSKPA
jgi:hypothetical protein